MNQFKQNEQVRIIPGIQVAGIGVTPWLCYAKILSCPDYARGITKYTISVGEQKIEIVEVLLRHTITPRKDLDDIITWDKCDWKPKHLR